MDRSSPLVGADALALASFCLYLLVVIGIGVAASRFSSGGVSEFFLAGRRLNQVVVALSAVVSGRSSWLLLGFSGMAYLKGASAVWTALGYILVEFVLFFGYARRLRTFSEARDCITLPDFFEARFPGGRGGLRLLLVLVILVFMTVYVSAQFVGGGATFASSFGWDPVVGMLLTAAIVLVYTVLGGFLAVSLTDLLQALFMVLALLVLPVVAIADIGGMGVLWSELRSLDPTLVDPTALTLGAAIGGLGIGLGSPGNPHILVRYMSIGDPAKLRGAAWIGLVWNVLMAAGALFIGMAGRVLFPSVEALTQGKNESVFPDLAAAELHPVLLGFVVAAIFAAIMSTADSQLLVAASGVVRDVYQKVLRRGRELDPKRLVAMSRWVVLALVGVAVLLAMDPKSLVFHLVLFAWGGLGAALGPTSILALFWKRTTRAGVLAGFLTGTVVLFAWELLPRLSEGTALHDQVVWMTGMYELVPAFGLSLLATWAVSLCTRPPGDVAGLWRDMGAEDSP